MADRFEDERGVIQDLLTTEVITAVTRIDTVAGAVRGNHIHYLTVQWVYVLSGRLRVAERRNGDVVTRQDWGPGELLREAPGIPHAWQALEDTSVLVFTRGPGSGENYESDTVRLKPEDRLL